ncbi:MauE/DoxX family redox-associated membrane protein [Elizabethkingia ursingii]|jgi:hypothetical protein|uniref:MauE/DoxX family redox-associated membrane protein n=1 Tax=Elizabethkingia ursingii TaxID=1756150 RepID=UPI0007507373|nr:MauE/DoxX family redox-associated membrane protein [Elizabethkingia ursingii]KUY29544.1 hypothetical protein ATB96_02435 [Elizabethkingia ursingii]
MKVFVNIVSYFFVLLFVYAAISKLMDFEAFQVQLAQSPLLSAYANFISLALIIIELIIAVLLCINRARLLGLYASFGLMIAFTVYIYLILNYSDFVPCSCGGILEKLGWTEHLFFNIGCIVLAAIAIFILKNPAKTERKRLQYTLVLIIIAIGSSSLVIGLFLSSEHIIKKENNFTRRFPPHPIDRPSYLDLKTNSFYFAGQNGDTIYLGNKSAPLIMGTVMPNFNGIKIDTLKLDDMTLPFREVKLQIDYPYYTLSDGHVPAVFEGKFPDKTAKLVMRDQAYFSRMIMVTPHKSIFRGQSTLTGENIMGLLSIAPKTQINFNTTFLEKQIDGVFDTDGSFIRDPKAKKIIYTYFYRNEYRVLDSTLSFSGKGKTIDTISKAQLKLATLKDGTTKMSAPPLKVNIDQAAYDELLFNESNLRGKHESTEMWKEAKIVDVYHYPTGDYRYSFYVHHNKQEKMRSMLVTKKHFYALRENQLIKYQRMR